MAFTRAKNKLYLTDAGGYSYVLQRVRVPSRFIEEIDPNYIEHIGVNAENGQFKEHNLSNILFDTKEEAFFEKLERTSTTAYRKGELVVHDKFGEGVVLKVDGGFVEIAFPFPHGVKKLMAAHPSLKKKEEIVN